MGNAALTIHHPASLEHEVPYLEHGKVVESSGTMLRLEKSGGAVVGCGGRVLFKNAASDSQWTYRVSQHISSDAQIGDEITVLAPDRPEADDQVAAKLGMSWCDVRESVALVKSTIGDSNACSELYCYVDYNVTNSGRHEWTRNDLYLKATHTWEGSEMVIDITFLTDEEKEIEKEKQKEMAKTMRNVIFMFGNNTTDVTSTT